MKNKIAFYEFISIFFDGIIPRGLRKKIEIGKLG